MRNYGELIDVRKGLVAGCEAPEQFVWRDRLWVVRTIIGHWVETGAWWEQAGVAALLGVGGGTTSAGGELEAARSGRLGADLLGERDG